MSIPMITQEVINECMDHTMTKQLGVLSNIVHNMIKNAIGGNMAQQGYREPIYMHPGSSTFVPAWNIGSGLDRLAVDIRRHHTYFNKTSISR